MAGETPITIVGNLTADPELRTTGNGGTVVNFTIASTPRTYNRNSGQWEDGDALFLLGFPVQPDGNEYFPVVVQRHARYCTGQSDPAFLSDAVR